MEINTLKRPSEFLISPLHYGTRVSGASEAYSMTLEDMDTYIRRHMPKIKRARVGLPTFDGMMTALIIDPTPSSPIDVVRVLLAASPCPHEENDPDFINFCGAVFARYAHIVRTLLLSPAPDTAGDFYEVEAHLPNYPDAFTPIISLSPEMPHEPTAWSIGFHNVVFQRPEVWHPLTRNHPHYQELGHIMYFVPNRKGCPSNKSIKNHHPDNQHRYATRGLAADAITAFHYFRPPKQANAAHQN